jgi:D-alanyl-D-alanine carboxypeptidase/D-alanyl-D-alanine-endopeptidase (penicillin-binding protein 4)
MLAVIQRSADTAVADGLAVAARTGTLSDEFLGSPLAGRLSAKTGTLGNPPFDEPPLASKALVGYVDADNGDTIEFALIVNAPILTTDSYRRLWALYGDGLATYPAGPSVTDLQP